MGDVDIDGYVETEYENVKREYVAVQKCVAKWSFDLYQAHIHYTTLIKSKKTLIRELEKETNKLELIRRKNESTCMSTHIALYIHTRAIEERLPYIFYKYTGSHIKYGIIILS